ncbi:MAG: hypothetical protein ACRETI_08130 [Steroidobacteraceae bacterium]
MTPGTAAAFTACVLLSPAGDALAAGKVHVGVGRLEFGGLAIEDLRVDWAPRAQAPGSLDLRAARIRGIAATGPLSAFSLDCPALRIEGDELSCERGRLSGSLGTLGVQDTRFRARRAGDGSLHLGFDNFAIAKGGGRLDFSLRGSSWTMHAALRGLEIGLLAIVAKPWLPLPPDFTVAGKAAGDVRASGKGELLQAAEARVALETLDFADAAGALAGERLAGNLEIDATAKSAGGFATTGRLALTAGQAYSDPVFLDFGVHGAEIDFSGELDTESARLRAGAFSLDHSGVLLASGSATLDFGGDTLLPEARVKISDLDVASALPAYAQPFLIDSALKDLEGAGSLRGEVDVEGGLPTRAVLDFDAVTVHSAAAALTLKGLRGRVNWFDDATRTALAGRIDDSLFHSRLSWDSGRLWGLELGATELPFSTTGRHFRMLEPVLLPIFDGGLAIETLRIRHAGTAEMYLRFDAALHPIGVAHLSRAFGWPEFQGTLAGSIPGLQLREGVVTLAGNLEAAVFDGRVIVRDLSLSDPLGKFPRLRASVDIEDLDLALVTRTFSFGSITGRLSGRISDLETFGWMPEAFDAFLYTPPDDRSKHRISQRAVTNLSSIGGGSGGSVAAALQGGFLKFFDDFGYDRLGLSCRLANDVCIMGGVENTAGGYYIVKGAGLPRIDVIGSQSRVAWTTLVRQLGAVMESEIVVE